MPKDDSHTIKTVYAVFVELIFAVLPLLVLAAVWPDHDQKHPQNFFWGPELSMTACILYGLSISKYINGVITRHNKDRDNSLISSAIVLILAVHILFLIGSVILIAKMAIFSDSGFLFYAQIVNLLMSGVFFLIFGGHGMRAGE